MDKKTSVTEEFLVTEELLELGKSSKNGWSKAQIRLLGMNNYYTNWKKDIIGRSISEENAKKFIDLKDKHVPKKNKGNKNQIKIDY